MRYLLMVFFSATMCFCSGCNRKKNVSDFPLSATLTLDELEDKMGTPTITANSNLWAAYTLKDGQELRLYFLNGPRGGTRTLSQAAIYSPSGIRIKTIFEAPKVEGSGGEGEKGRGGEMGTTAPATQAATMPATTQAVGPEGKKE